MSMIGKYARLTPDELARAIREPRWGREFVRELIETEPDEDAEASAARCHDVDKVWDALDFLLRRIGFPVDIVHGEEEILGADDWGYGPPHCLPPERVRIAADALTATPHDSLVGGVTPADLAQADIYPDVIWEREDSMDYVTGKYEALVSFFRTAAGDGDAVVTWIG